MTAMREPCAAACLATAGAFRRHGVKTGVDLAAAARALPFGDGSTRRVPGSIDRSEAGESVYRPASRREPARTARFSAANRSANPSFQPYGTTVAPRERATSTAVEN